MNQNNHQINILIPKDSWFEKYALKLKKKLEKKYEVKIIYNQNKLRKSIITFILSYQKKIITKNLRKSKFNIVVHASNLPKGRGFSPMSWQILEGKNTIPFTLFQANEEIDTGDFFLKDKIVLKGHELSNEWRKLQGDKTIELCLKFVKKMNELIPKPQVNQNYSYYRRRKKIDSILDVNKSIKDQFNLLRIVDNENYPAYFIYKNKKYKVKIEKL